MASKKRRSGKGKGSRQGISGNPQRRAEELAQRRPVIAAEPDLPPLVLDFRSGRAVLLDMETMETFDPVAERNEGP